MPTPHHEAVRRAIQGLQGTLTVAAALLEAGRIVDLRGLEREVAALCSAVAVLPAAEGRALCIELSTLLGQVQGLEARMAPA
ncbi:hypothetical protein LPC08_21820 [Roseomonas sp. OT10]|uniref:hypothetical protein n=1 Tax=Roseomonas cutis TaxID=2897332 RepID=UPI001E2DC38A|nr:hypothetical protein [Roseomonas sp. OT10]UFN48619.1 hypothetical protein LPC08_21820 [Roseomonas sp. OT10]